MSLFRRAALAAQSALNATGVLDFVEERILPASTAMPLSPILIVGSPRSGTTLLYELLTGHFRTAYPSNIAALLYRSPVLATRIGLRLAGRHEPRYESTIGYVGGVLGPSEAGALMRHWFTGSAPLAAHRPHRFLQTVAGLSDAMQGPLVLKNLYLDKALDLVLASLADLVVLRIHRDQRFTAQSILAVRRKETGSEAGWWGPEPAGIETMTSTEPIEQVAWQVTAIEKSIDRMTQRPGIVSNCFDCEYEQLCSDPAGVMEAFAAFYQERTGTALTRLRAIPSSFSVSEKITLDPNRWKALEDALVAARRGA